MHASPITDRVIRHVSLHTPNLFAANVALLGLHYFLRNHFLPHALSSDKAGLMDYIFWRSVGPWSAFEKSCVDKDLSKEVANRLCPRIGIAEPLAVFPLAGLSFSEFRRRLLVFTGQSAVAKPTHGSGAVIFLDEQPPDRRYGNSTATAKLPISHCFARANTTSWRRRS